MAHVVFHFLVPWHVVKHGRQCPGKAAGTGTRRHISRRIAGGSIPHPGANRLPSTRSALGGLCGGDTILTI